MQQPVTGSKVSVLVLGEDTRSFLSVIRSLGEAGYEVHVVCYDRTSPALASKYITTVKFYNYQALTAQDWLNSVIALVQRYQFDVIIPCDERALYPLWSAKERLPSHTQLAIANPQALEHLFDKWKTKRVAQTCGVPVAEGHITTIVETSYDQLQQRYGDLFVVKPLQSFEEDKLSQRQKVVIIHSAEDFAAFQHANDSHHTYLIEAFFAGKGEGVSVLSIQGEVYAAFAHVRVAEPNSGGGSSYRKSIPLDPALLEAAEQMCRQTQLTGVAMFEFRRNEADQWILVEVNARFWGSLPLAVYAGVDFPKMYVDYMVTNQPPQRKVLQYRSVTARALTADIYEMKREFELFSDTRGTSIARKYLLGRLLQIGQVIIPKETIDSLQWHDMKPFLAECSALFRTLVLAKLRKTRVLIRYRRYKTQRQLALLFKRNPRRRILFVCYGNIMRSPFAAAYFQDSAAQQHISLRWDSFGFHLIEQRSCPQSAFQAAQRLGEDLTCHQSKWLSQLDIRETDIVIYFDRQNYSKLHAYYQVNHAFCAADLLDNQFPKLADIDDPYGRSIEGVEECYRKISNSVTRLLTIYKEAVQ